MTTTTPFAAFYLNVTGDCIEEQIAHDLARNGMITFDAIQSKEDLLHLCRRLGAIVKHRDADETGLTHIVKREDIQFIKGYQAFTNSHLTLHTDGSSVPDPATLVVLWCVQPAEEGGISLFVDGKLLYQVLAKEHPLVLTTLTTPHSAIFAGAKAPLYSSVFSMPESGTVCIRFRYDGLGYYIAPACKVLPTFLELLNHYKISFSLCKHQGYIIHNKRWLHGRTAFCGEREMYRVLIHTNPTTLIGKCTHSGFKLDSCL
ncbi:MAG: TauD/TfdA family dioxygenase [Ktedonobacteraceae bacterium]|nr:TauD/TfdA family dioxygenase [Ktedonobacteraceae bacterium]